MTNTITKIKNTLERINSRLGDTEEHRSDVLQNNGNCPFRTTTTIIKFKIRQFGNLITVHWLGCYAHTAWVMDSVPDQELRS